MKYPEKVVFACSVIYISRYLNLNLSFKGGGGIWYLFYNNIVFVEDIYRFLLALSIILDLSKFAVLF